MVVVKFGALVPIDDDKLCLASSPGCLLTIVREQ